MSTKNEIYVHLCIQMYQSRGQDIPWGQEGLRVKSQDNPQVRGQCEGCDPDSVS